MKDIVSIIIPAYNVEDYIIDALESCLNQTYNNLEIIVVNDGSTDNTGKICDEYAVKNKNIKVIHKTNGGVASARNKGIDNAKGKYIFFLDPDDYIDFNAIELMYNKISETNADVCFATGKKICEKKEVGIFAALHTKKEVFYKINNEEDFFVFISQNNVWSILMKTDIVKKTRFNEDFRLYEDFIFRFELFRCVKSFVYLKKPVYNYVKRMSSLSHSSDFEYKISYFNKMVSLVRELVKQYNYPTDLETLVNSLYLNCTFNNYIDNAFLSENEKTYNAIQSYVKNENFKKAIKKYNKILINKKATIGLKLITICKLESAQVLAIYLYHYGINLYNFLRRN